MQSGRKTREVGNRGLEKVNFIISPIILPIASPLYFLLELHSKDWLWVAMNAEETLNTVTHSIITSHDFMKVFVEVLLL